MSGSTFVDNDFCFACGTRNPLGLQLQFYSAGSALQTRFRPQPHWQGFQGVLHGGVQTTILDDLMCNHLFRLEKVATTTAELTVRFRLPVPMEAELLFTSVLVSRRGRLWELQGTLELYGGDRTALTTATGRFMEITEQP